MIKIKKGLDLPITGAPTQEIGTGQSVNQVAVVGFDYVGMKPTMEVKVGDKVQKGQVLFSDKKNPGVLYTAPASGTVSAVNRGDKRVLQSVVVDVAGDDAVSFNKYSADQIATLDRQSVVDQLVKSGEWTAFKTRPFSRVPGIDAKPNSIFVTAMDTNPLAADPAVVIAGAQADFDAGLKVLEVLTEGKVFVCKEAGAAVNASGGKVQVEEFTGPHPAGLAGTHIHFLDPVSANKQVWSIGYQDVIALGRFFTTGVISNEVVVALAGPQVTNPRLVKTLRGASLDQLMKGETSGEEIRVISGSVLSGRTAAGGLAYLGRHHTQVTVLEEGREREMFHYLRAGFNKHSVMNIYVSKLFGGLKSFTTTTNGSDRGMVPVGNYEKVMPLDILPTQLLRALIVEDMDTAINLGALELDEEDLALCTYACQSKYEYGPILRANLERIEKEA